MFLGMQDKATVERFKNQSSGRRRERFPACSVVGPGGTNPFSVGFAVAIHVADVWLGHLSAVETVQETSGDLRDQGSIWDGLGHAVDRSLQEQEHKWAYKHPDTSSVS